MGHCAHNNQQVAPDPSHNVSRQARRRGRGSEQRASGVLGALMCEWRHATQRASLALSAPTSNSSKAYSVVAARPRRPSPVSPSERRRAVKGPALPNDEVGVRAATWTSLCTQGGGGLGDMGGWPQPTNVSLQHYRGLHAQPTQRPGAQSRGLVQKRLSSHKTTLHLDSGVAETAGRVQLGVGEWDESVCVQTPKPFFRQCTERSLDLDPPGPHGPRIKVTTPPQRLPPHVQHDGDAIYKVGNQVGREGWWWWGE